MEKYKEELLQKVKKHIDFVRGKIKESLIIVKEQANVSLRELAKLEPADQEVFMNIRANAQDREVALEHLDGSPYFMKCEVIDEKGEKKDYYIAKHQFYDQSIYSWVAPVAAIRFEDPGEATYKIPNGTVRKVTITQKEQYMIVDGKVLFYAQETKDKPRELIYQEHFTRQKTGFVLPEIVAQMEKAQDQVIRAGHIGPLVISGPAGSGKTTLALHRVAYLTQAPGTDVLYPAKSIIVFVQDTGTKEYFNALLPGLGIHNVQITTFYEWGLKILNITDHLYTERYGNNDEEKDIYEYQKIQALREKPLPSWNKDIYRTLKSNYGAYFSKNTLSLFEKQKQEKVLDRFDLTILLQAYLKKHKKFEIRRQYQTFVKNDLVTKTEKTLITYSLAIVDEFQNYLPEQLQILNSCLNKETKSSVYVGDIAQQVKLGTIKNIEDIGEFIPMERKIRLNKVYRNTKNILRFIQSLNYTIEIPDGIKEGPIVIEKITKSKEEEIKHIQEIISKYTEGSVGILAKNEAYLQEFKETFTGHKNVHILTMLESQGVEFDIVFIVGVSKKSFEVTHHTDALSEHIEERKRMQKDLMYVALTRAINELHILGENELNSVFK